MNYNIKNANTAHVLITLDRNGNTFTVCKVDKIANRTRWWKNIDTYAQAEMIFNGLCANAHITPEESKIDIDDFANVD